MTIKWYYIAPILAFVLILLNAFFGHLIFSSPYNQDINKYSIYVHFQPEWNSYPRNLIFDVTNVWEKNDSNVKFGGTFDESIPLKTIGSYNYNEIQYINDKPFVELKHGFSDCKDSWRPILYRYAIDTLRTQIEHIQGEQLSSDPYISKFRITENSRYTLEEQSSKIKSGYVQFIPICSEKKNTNYEYSVRINDDNLGFDVFFVTSKHELDNYINNSTSFDFYKKDGCLGHNYSSFNGVCDDVGANSGLLILIPDELSNSLTTVTVNLHEIS